VRFWIVRACNLIVNSYFAYSAPNTFPALQTRVFKKIGKTITNSYNNFITNGPSPTGQMDRHRKEQIIKSVGLKPHRTGSGLLSNDQAGNGAKSSNSKTEKKGAVVTSAQETRYLLSSLALKGLPYPNRLVRPSERALILDVV